MGLNERDIKATKTTEESRQAKTNDSANPATNDAPKSTSRSPDLRRRALIAGLAATPVLLSLTNRSALGQANVNCSLLYSVMLGGSVHDLPNGWEHKGPNYIQEQYEQHCVEGGEPGTGNATGNSGHTTNGNASGN